MKKFNWKIVLHLAVSVFLIFLAIHYWPNAAGIIKTVFSAATPLLFGLITAYPLNILMSFYQRHLFPKSKKKATQKLRKPLSLISAIITILGLTALVSVLIIPQLINCVKLLVAELPGAIEAVITKLNSFEFISDDLLKSLSSIDWKSRIGDIAKALTSGLGSVMNIAVTAVTSVFSVVSNVVIGIIFALYLLLEKDKILVQLNRAATHFIPERVYGKLRYVLSVTNGCFRRFIVGQCTEAIILGSLCALGMMILRIPYAAMIGALMAFTALIPIVGGFIGAGVGAFLILMESPMKALIFLIFVIVLQQLEGNLIYPKVVGSSIGLPGIWVLAAVTVGGGVMGIGGMLLGVPLAATIYKLLKEHLDRSETAAQNNETENITQPE